MKFPFLLVLILCFSKLYSQDSLKIKQIDSLVTIILHSDFPTQRDSIIQDMPALGLKMKTYLTLVSFGKQLKRYVNKQNTIKQENGEAKLFITGSAFYFDNNKLIKAEEFIVQGDKEEHFEWYFSDDKCFHYTSQSEKAKDRALFLVQLSNGILKQFLNKN